ncbi:MAG: hypothetical protein JG775_1842 [Defluviitaleaceae bacterium]|nr:hypothetical protein [Defluviitaleaceae bacterium]
MLEVTFQFLIGIIKTHKNMLKIKLSLFDRKLYLLILC